MKIEKMIEQLQSITEKYPEAEIKMHHHSGNTALFCLCTLIHGKPIVFIEDESDIDTRNELYAQIDHAKDCNIKDVDLLQNLFAIGFTWKNLKDWLDKEDYDYFVEVGKACGFLG